MSIDFSTRECDCHVYYYPQHPMRHTAIKMPSFGKKNKKDEPASTSTTAKETKNEKNKDAKQKITQAGKAAADVSHAVLKAGAKTVLEGVRGVYKAGREVKDNVNCGKAIRDLQLANDKQTEKYMNKVDSVCVPATDKHCDDFKMALDAANDSNKGMLGMSKSSLQIMKNSKEARMCNFQ